MFQTVPNPWSLLASVCRPATRVAALLVMVALLGAASASAQVVVFAPHPDDEALFASGIIYQARQSGKTVKVVVATNGDCEDPTIGHTRERETIAAMALLGVPASDVIFLGYADCGLREMYHYYTTATSQFTSAAGFRQTYAYEGFGSVDYHTQIYGVPANYSGYSVIQDIQTVLRNYKPQDVYVTSVYDANFDHYALNFMVLEATLALMQSDATFQPTIHEALVHEPCELCDPNYHWPLPSFTPTTPFPMPASLPPTPLSWTGAERVIVPSIMQLLTPATNLKSRAIMEYVSQGGGIGSWLQAFVKSDEVFWKTELWANRAIQATATASSSLNTGNTVDHINDGAVVGTPVVPVNRGRKGEWISNNQVAGAWAQLTWTTSRAVTSVVLHDRTDPAENITAGTLTFSDGSSIAVGALPTTGVGLTVQFAQKNITWVRFTASSGQGSAVGLSEFEVYGPATAKLPWQAPGGNTQPAIVGGPTATPATITDTDTSTLTVAGFDSDGDALTYSWTSSGGRVDGIGSTVTFVPPTVTAPTTYQVTVYVADGRGGLLSSSIPIVVTHSNGPHNIASSATATASSHSIAHGQTADKAIDGIVSGYPTDSLREWATEGQLAGAWIQLTWPTPRTISRSVLHDRINTADRILAGTLRFSDGSTVAVGALPNDGAGLITDFAARTVTWIRFEITSAQGGSTGLAEWEVFSAASGGGSNVSPQITSGPTATPSSINDIQTSNLSVVASDADGDTLTYTWQTTGGSIVGSGANVSFTPPHVTAPTTVRVDVLVLDGRGGSATGFVNISVAPSSTSLNLALFATATASTANDGRGQGADKAIDGVVDGYPTDSSREWASVGQLTGAWIQLTWPAPQMIAQVVLHDRINTSDQILAGTLRFSDGSTVGCWRPARQRRSRDGQLRAPKRVVGATRSQRRQRRQHRARRVRGLRTVRRAGEYAASDHVGPDGNAGNNHRHPDDESDGRCQRCRRRPLDLRLADHGRLNHRRPHRDLHTAPDHGADDIPSHGQRQRWPGRV